MGACQERGDSEEEESGQAHTGPTAGNQRNAKYGRDMSEVYRIQRTMKILNY